MALVWFVCLSAAFLCHICHNLFWITAHLFCHFPLETSIFLSSTPTARMAEWERESSRGDECIHCQWVSGYYIKQFILDTELSAQYIRHRLIKVIVTVVATWVTPGDRRKIVTAWMTNSMMGGRAVYQHSDVQTFTSVTMISNEFCQWQEDGGASLEGRGFVDCGG